MQIHMDEEKRIAEIWLTKAESDDPALILAHIGEPTKSRPVPGNDQPHNSPFPANTTTGK